MRQFLIAVIALALCSLATAEEPDDPYLWLEEIQGEEALNWVEERSAADTATLEAVLTPEQVERYRALLEEQEALREEGRQRDGGGDEGGRDGQPGSLAGNFQPRGSQCT